MLPYEFWADQQEICLQAAERKAVKMGLTMSEDAAEERPVTCNFKVDEGALPAIAENGALSTHSSPQKEVRSPSAPHNQPTAAIAGHQAPAMLTCLPSLPQSTASDIQLLQQLCPFLPLAILILLPGIQINA